MTRYVPVFPRPKVKAATRCDFATDLPLALDGDPAAQDRVEAAAMKYAAGVARRMNASHDTASEAAAIVFARLFRGEQPGVGLFDPARGRSFEAWLAEIAANAVRDLWRKARSREVGTVPLRPNRVDRDPLSDPAAAYEAQQERDVARARVKPEDRVILEMAERGAPLAEIAEARGVTVAHLQRLVRGYLNQYTNEGNIQ